MYQNTSPQPALPASHHEDSGRTTPINPSGSLYNPIAFQRGQRASIYILGSHIDATSPYGGSIIPINILGGLNTSINTRSSQNNSSKGCEGSNNATSAAAAAPKGSSNSNNNDTGDAYVDNANNSSRRQHQQQQQQSKRRSQPHLGRKKKEETATQRK